jgi:glycosyltransferase involved in cell wall biosynthesis
MNATTDGTSRVAVIVPLLDAERYVEETLDSVLAQTLPVHEILVVDNGSTDRSIDIVRTTQRRHAQVHLLHEPVRSVGRARNAALRALSPDVDWIALCDADDLWRPRRLEAQFDAVSDDPTVEAVFCGVDEFVSPDIDPQARTGRAPRVGIVARLASALLVHRRAVDRVGPFVDSDLGEDWLDWAGRLSDVTHTAFVREVLVDRRLHDRNASLRTEMGAAYLGALRRRLVTGRDGTG